MNNDVRKTCDRIAAWNEFASMNRYAWLSYCGGCECPSCHGYREEFERWFVETVSRGNQVENSPLPGRGQQ